MHEASKHSFQLTGFPGSMYEKTLQLKQRPFTTATDAGGWCDTGNAGPAVQQMFQTLARNMGIPVLVAAPGTGKTLALEMLARQCSAQNHEVVQITASRLDQRRDVLQRILFELNLPNREMGDSDLRLSLIQHFRSVCGQHGRNVLLLVDEAQNLSVELLDELRIMTESACRNQGGCHLVLAGTSRLEELLNHTDLDLFNQRIACRVYLKAMDREETARYVRQHMQRAGGGKREYFSADALREIASVTAGVPRLVNQVCDQCLLVLASAGGKTVTGEMVADAWCDIQNLPRQKRAARTASSGSLSETAGPEVSGSATVEFGTLDDEPASGPRPRRRSEKTKQKVAQADPLIHEIDRLRKELHESLRGAGEPPGGGRSPRGVRPETAADPFAEHFESEERVAMHPAATTKTARNAGAPGETVRPGIPEDLVDTAETSTGWITSSSIAASIADVETASDPFLSEQQKMTGFPHYSGELPSGAKGRVSPADSNAGNPTASGYEAVAYHGQTPKVAVHKPAVLSSGLDDRDILISGDATCFEPTATGETREPEDSGDADRESTPLRGPHSARAVRMEYRQLFSQLRDGQSP